MTGGILRDLANAAESRRESRKTFVQACRRLANRIVETGRVGDRACVHKRVYAIENVAWTLSDKDGRPYEYESHPPVRTLAVHSGSWYVDPTLGGTCFDDRDLVSLLELTAPGTDPVDSAPHYAGLAGILEAEREGAYDIEGIGPTEFKPASNADYEVFAADAEEILAGFIECLRDEDNRKRKATEKLDALNH
jgi:hypothetical protein